MFFSGLEKAYVYQYGESLVVGKTEGEYPEFLTLALLNISFFIFQMISKRKPKIQVFFLSRMTTLAAGLCPSLLLSLF